MLMGSQVAIITPFTKNNRIDEKALYELVIWHKQQKTDAIVCCGTTGETPTLSEEEKQLVIKICVDAAGGSMPVIAGTGCYNTYKSVERTCKAGEIGASACLVIVPYYNKPTQKGCVEHFKEIASVGVKIIVYHHPGRTGTSLLPYTFSLIEEIDNIVAIKEASGSLEFIDEIKKYCYLPILSGDDKLTIPIMAKGGVGVISVIANCLPSVMKDIVDLCNNNKHSQAQKIFERYRPLCDAIMLETNPQGIKYALSLMGKSGASLRLPLLEPATETKAIIKINMKLLGLI
jgi:4-hydroxy-tetrahydrodipicolinate synthase